MIKFEPPPIDETGFEQSMEENDNEAQGTFRCSLCGRFYKWMKDLKRHRHGCGDQKPKFPCRICKNVFSRGDTLTRHYKRKHNKIPLNQIREKKQS